MPLPETLVANADFLRTNSVVPRAVADATALQAVVSTELVGGEIISLVTVAGRTYVFILADAGADDGDKTIKPTDAGGTGRWRKLADLAV